jgi:hypothetical protein
MNMGLALVSATTEMASEEAPLRATRSTASMEALKTSHSRNGFFLQYCTESFTSSRTRYTDVLAVM